MYKNLHKKPVKGAVTSILIKIHFFLANSANIYSQSTSCLFCVHLEKKSDTQLWLCKWGNKESGLGQAS